VLTCSQMGCWNRADAKSGLCKDHRKLRVPRPRCEHCRAFKKTWAGLCPKCMRFGTPRDNRVQSGSP
jgi:hypothetical protein